MPQEGRDLAVVEGNKAQDLTRNAFQIRVDFQSLKIFHAYCERCIFRPEAVKIIVIRPKYLFLRRCLCRCGYASNLKVEFTMWMSFKTRAKVLMALRINL